MEEEKILIKIKDVKSGLEQEIVIRDIGNIEYLKNRILQGLAKIITEKHIK